jgi:hypothetical protein
VRAAPPELTKPAQLPPYRCQSTNTPELRFRAVLTGDGARKVELARDWGSPVKRSIELRL